MGPDILDFLGLREDLKKVVLGEEVEAGKHGALLLNVVLETTLHSIELIVALLERREKFDVLDWTIASLEYVALDSWVVSCSLDDFFPGLVDVLELSALSWKLLLDVRGVEDRLEVGPVGHAFLPFFEDV